MLGIAKVSAIALNTFRETVRDRILYAIVLFALVATLSGLIFSSLSVEQEIRVFLDLGLFTITIFGALIAIFVGTNLVFKELDRRTIYLIFTKPISKGEFITGKFLGLALCLLVVIFGMGMFLYGVLCLQIGSFFPVLPLLGALSLVYLEILLLISMATCFSTFATPLMSMLFTMGLWLSGHLENSLLNLGRMSESPAVRDMTRIIYYALPDLANLTMIRSEMVDAKFPPPVDIMTIVAYVVVYSMLLLSLATFIAQRREFQ